MSDCLSCGYQGDDKEFEFEMVFPRLSVGDFVRIVCSGICKEGHVLSVSNPNWWEHPPAYIIELKGVDGEVYFWKSAIDGGFVERAHYDGSRFENREQIISDLTHDFRDEEW